MSEMAKQMTTAETKEYRKLMKLHRSAKMCIWTYPMLRALDNKEKGWKWYTLKDKICKAEVLSYAYLQVEENYGSAGIDKVTIEMYEKDLSENLACLQKQLLENRYEPSPIKRVYIDKPGSKAKRPLGIPTVKQRIVENAIKMGIEPIFENIFLPCNYGFRPNRGNKDALREVSTKLKDGYKFVVDADIKSYFDNINHELLMSFIAEEVADKWVLGMIKKFLKNRVVEGDKEWSSTVGSPQGSVLSPLLSNIYLHRLDERLTREGYELVRYADDFVIMCQTLEEAQRGLEITREVMTKLKLMLHPEKTRIIEVTEKEGFEFLGYLFLLNRRRPKDKALKSLRLKVKQITPRSGGQSLKTVIEDLNPVLRGWYGYFKHVRNSPSTFREMDGYIRRRLRSILAKFHKKCGSHRMMDNYKWINDYFHSQGLFSLQKNYENELALARGDH